MDDKLILLNKLARAAGVKPGTAREAARRGYLKAQRIETPVGPAWFVTKEDFAAWLNDPRFHMVLGKYLKTGY